MAHPHYWPEGKARALTLSFDDGRIQDRDLVAILNRYHIPCTFHIVSSRLGRERYISVDELTDLYRGHEVALHGHRHLRLPELSVQEMQEEVAENQRQLEALTGYPVRGMSYAYGAYNEEAVKVLEAMGVVYCRTIVTTDSFALPENLLTWHPTIHYARGHGDYSNDPDDPKGLLLCKTRELLDGPVGSLLYVWGYSYEFDTWDNWQTMDAFGQLVSGQPDVWCATNMEVAQYILALRALAYSEDGKTVYNPTATDVWLQINGRPVKLPAGGTL